MPISLERYPLTVTETVARVHPEIMVISAVPGPTAAKRPFVDMVAASKFWSLESGPAAGAITSGFDVCHTNEGLGTELSNPGLASEPDIRPASVRAWAGVQILRDTDSIEEVARRLGMRSLDRAARLIGHQWNIACEHETVD